MCYVTDKRISHTMVQITGGGAVGPQPPLMKHEAPRNPRIMCKIKLFLMYGLLTGDGLSPVR